MITWAELYSFCLIIIGVERAARLFFCIRAGWGVWPATYT